MRGRMITARGGGGPPGGGSAGRWAVLLIAGVYFLVPLYSALRSAGFHSFGTLFVQPGLWPSLWLSARLALMTTIVTLVL